MNWLLRRYRLLKLKCREYVLQAALDDHEHLWADHERRYLNAINTHKAKHRLALRELHQVKARIAQMERPEILLRRAA